MSEKLVKNIGRKMTLVALAGILLLGSGCATYRTMLPSTIPKVRPIERQIKRQIKRPIDYSKLTWQEAIEHVQTPEQAQDYLNNHFTSDPDENQDDGKGVWIPGSSNTTGIRGETFKYNHKKQKGLCFDYTTSAAALLSDNNFPPLLLTMYKGTDGHTVFLYRTDSGYGALGNSPMDPVYFSVEDLVNGFKERYNWSFDKFNIVNLDEAYKNKEWVSGDMDLIKNLPVP